MCKLALYLIVLVSFCVLSEAQKSKYENIDVDKILSNQRLLDSYIKCLLEKAPCTPEGKNLKEDIPKALKDNCADCTPKEKEVIRKAVKYVMKNKANEWELIKQHYDPTGKYKENFNKFINEQN